MTKIVPQEEVRQFIERALIKVGVDPSHASSLADNLLAADYRGHFSHGLNRTGLIWLKSFNKTFLLILILIYSRILHQRYS